MTKAPRKASAKTKAAPRKKGATPARKASTTDSAARKSTAQKPAGKASVASKAAPAKASAKRANAGSDRAVSTARTRKSAPPGKPDVTVQITRLPHGQDLPLPAYQSEGAAGLDLLAAVGWDTPLTLLPGSRSLVPTGLQIALPSGFEAQVRPRSGLALASGVTVLNSPGTIDCDYRGEVAVLLVNLSGTPFEVRRGERIAQLVIAPVTRAALVEVEALDTTARGAGGFGSTGKG